MENGLFAYIFRYSWRQQVLLTLLTFVAFPFYYFSLDLPKTIINKAIGGTDFPVDVSVGAGGSELSLGQFDQVPYLLILCFVFLLLVLINSGIKLLINIYRGVMGERMLRRLRLSLIERIMKFPLSRFRETSQGELVSMVSQETEPLGGFIGEAISLPLYQGGLLLTVLTFMFVQDWKLGVAAIALYPLQGWLIPKLQKQVNALNQQRTIRMRKLAENLGEVVSGINEIHVNDNSLFFKDHFSKLLGRIFNIRVQIFKKKFFIKFLNNAIAQLTPFLFFLIGGLLVIQGDMSIGALVAAIAAYKDLSPSWKELLTWYQRQADARLKFSILVDRFKIDPLTFIQKEADTQQWLHEFPSQPIRASNLSLSRYDGVKELSNVSMSIRAGEWISIVGSGNSGRNGLAHLLARLVDPSGGKLIMAERDVTIASEALTGRTIAYVGHDSYLFSSTIRDNILLSLKYRPHKSKIENYIPDETIDFNGWQREARLSGNSQIAQDADWIDYSSTGVVDKQQFAECLSTLLNTVRLEDELVRYALARTIDAAEYNGISSRIAEARALFKQRLSEKGLDSLVEFFDPEMYNTNASIAENILYGVSAQAQFSADGLAEHPVLRELLAELELSTLFDDAAIATASTMVELFSDFPAGHDFFDRFSFIDTDELAELKRILDLLKNKDSIDELEKPERKLLRSLPYKLISGRHRIGSLKQLDPSSVLALRRKFLEKLDQQSRSQIELFSSERYISQTPIIDNVIFGRIAFGRLEAEEKVYKLVIEVLQELDMMSPIVEIGLSASAGLGGSLLSVSQRQKILLARSLIKNPNILIINEGLSSLDTDETQLILSNLKTRYPGMRVIWVDSQPRHASLFDRVVHLESGRISKIEELSAGAQEVDFESLPAAREPVRNSKSVDINEKLALLNGIPLFRFLDTPNLRLLSENCDTVDLAAGEQLFAQGDLGDAMYIVIDGKAGIYISNTDGVKQVRECTVNEEIGELALISEEPRSATVVALTDLALLRLKKEIFIDVVRANGEIGYQVLSVVISRFYDTNKKIIKRLQT